MLERLGAAWRVLATGLCFVVFGLGGLLLRFVAFPLLALVVRAPPARQRAARRLIRATMVAFVAFMRLLGVLAVEVQGAERLRRRGQIVLANHPTLIDVVLLTTLVGDAVCIVKSGLAENAFTRGPVLTAGFLRNGDGPELIDAAVQALRAGSNLLIFPEGTRTPHSGELSLQRGAASIALHAGVDITPVVIHCRTRFLTKDSAWWQVPPRRAHIRLEVRGDIDVGAFAAPSGHHGKAARELTRHLKDFFEKELLRAGT